MTGEEGPMTLSPICIIVMSWERMNCLLEVIMYGTMSQVGCLFGKSVIFSFDCMHLQCNQKELFEVRIVMRNRPKSLRE